MKHLLLIATLLLSACSSIETKPLSYDEALNASYTGRYLAKEKNRNILESKIRDSEDYVLWNKSYNGSTYAGMGTEILTGNSNIGNLVNSAVFIAGIFVDDGQFDEVSQVFIPADVAKKRNITTKEEADKYVTEYMDARVMNLGKILGDGAVCMAGCGSKFQLYRVPVTNEYIRNKYGKEMRLGDGIDNLWIFTDTLEAEAIPVDHPINSALGYQVAWSTPTGNTAVIRFYTQAEIQDPEISENEDGFFVINNVYDINKREVSVRMRNSMFTEKGYMWGSNTAYPRRLVIDGSNYLYHGSSRWLFVNEAVEQPEKLDCESSC